jgi:nitrogen fixation/metabolism regulation signal transduction histidine kinase
MTKQTKKVQCARRVKGRLIAPGAQMRFILFLTFLLVAYTFLLKFFQKLASMPRVNLLIFVPVALVTLLVFIGIAGMLYSHRFVGPLARIRNALDQVARGDCSVSLRLRESDDPVLREVATKIVSLCEHSRNAHHLVREAAQDLLSELVELDEAVRKGAHSGDLQEHQERIHKKKAMLEQAVQSLGK